MATIEKIAKAAINGDALATRSLAQDWLRENPDFASVPRPQSQDPNLLAVAASLIEMFAERAGVSAPQWTAQVSAAITPIFLASRGCVDEKAAKVVRRKFAARFAPTADLRAAELS